MKQTDTDVHTENGGHGHQDAGSPANGSPRRRAGTNGWVGELLGEWQPAEVRLARSFPECRGLAAEQLEDLYQDTTLALLARPYTSEEHLRNALRHGIKNRALNLHRNQRRRTQILTHAAPSMQRIEEGRHSRSGPEEAVLGEQDRLIATEFLTELDDLEQRIFWLTAEGMRYRAIASVLGIAVNEARNASRSCERKRQRFQLLYDTGRLCGYRAGTIQALQDGQLTSVELAQRAFAHLDACTSCCAEHKTNAKRLSLSFRDQVAALLPMPAILGRLARSSHFVRGVQHAHARWVTLKQSGGAAGGRVTALAGAGGAGAKLTAGVVTVAVIAGGTVGATHALEHHATHGHQPATAAPGTTPTEHLGKGASLDLGTPRARRAVHGVAPANRAAGSKDSAALEATQREFAPEAAQSAPATTNQTATPTAESNQVAAEREFGIPPN
jgi:RNA polymerase sigma factor (sigma-70 family)